MARRGKILLQAAAISVVALLVALLGWRVAQQEAGRGLDDALAAGKRPQAPEFSLEPLEGEGRISLAALRGKAVVLNFWASWCGPCKDEAPLLQQAWERYRDDGLVVVGIDAQDFRVDARRFVERYDLTYPIAYDGKGSTIGRYGNTGFPETWFVGRDGRLVGEHISGAFSEEQLEENIQLALGTEAR
jgi:cytochrome c biogenesis protein CcmG/thiol:disulfide interchange protein DsbE